MNDNLARIQEWLTVFAYLGFTVFIIWRILVGVKK